jgi:hypothetical protein
LKFLGSGFETHSPALTAISRKAVVQTLLRRPRQTEKARPLLSHALRRSMASITHLANSSIKLFNATWIHALTTSHTSNINLPRELLPHAEENGKIVAQEERKRAMPLGCRRHNYITPLHLSFALHASSTAYSLMASDAVKALDQKAFRAYLLLPLS